MAFDYDGDWQNQLGSTMSLKVHPNGSVTGTFKSLEQGDPVPLVGFVGNDVIVFCNVFGTGAGTMLGQPLKDSDTSSFECSTE